MADQLTPSLVASNLAKLARQLDDLVAAIDDAEVRAVNAREDYTMAYARAFLTSEGSMDVRRHLATMETHDTRSLLAEAGVRMRTQAEYSLIDIDQAVAEYRRGRGLISMAQQYRVTAKTLSDALRAAGVEIRRPGRPRANPVMQENRVREAVRKRSGGRCEVCGLARATNFQHRKNRSQLGEWSIANGLDVCGMGNASGCHGRIHQNPLDAVGRGWSVLSWQEPAEVPVLLHYGWHKLADDGRAVPVPGPCPAGCAVWTPDNECDCQEAS